MNPEATLIAAVCANQDMASANSLGVDELFVTHKDVWKAIKDYYFKHRGLPPIEEVNKKFPGIDLVDPKLATGYAIDELRNAYAKRAMAELVQKTVSDLETSTPLLALDKMHQRVGELAKITATSRDLDVSDPKDMRDHILVTKERAEQMGGTVGIPTGFRAIDASYFTGMAPGHLIVVIGWPGRGKTWMTGYLAVKAWERGFRPMIVSLEMSPEVMRDRLYTMMGSGIFNMSDFSRGQVDIDDFDNWSSTYFENKNSFIVVSSEGQSEVTPSHIQSKIDQHKPDLVIVDYHQLMSDNQKSNSPQEANRIISLQLKRMAVRNAIPVIDVVSATMSNVSDQQGPPMLSQVAWSKAIEYDADHAIAVHRMDEEDSDVGAIELVCRKNRHGTEYDFMVEVDLGRGRIREVYE